MTITLEGMKSFIVSLLYNLYKLTNIYTSVAIQVLERIEEDLRNG